jgi:hypothetical protein
VVWSPRFLVVNTNGSTLVGCLSRVLVPEILDRRDGGTPDIFCRLRSSARLSRQGGGPLPTFAGRRG